MLLEGQAFSYAYCMLIMPGGYSGEVIPVPISNTEVKLSYADDTAAKWESR